MNASGPARYRAYSLDEIDTPEARARLLAAKQEQGLKVAMIAPAFNERGRIEKVAETCPRDLVDSFFVMDDGSTDGSADLVAKAGGIVDTVSERQGVGFAIRRGLHRARDEGFDIAVIIAGNGKDDPRQVNRLLWPIVMDGFQYVQGSRYIGGGAYSNMPLHRKLVTRAWPWLVFLATGQKMTEATNGFRAYSIKTLADAGMNLDQDWLAECIEHYIQVKVFLARLRVAEVPVSKHYPATKAYGKYTKVRVSKLYHRFKPLIYLPLGLKK